MAILNVDISSDLEEKEMKHFRAKKEKFMFTQVASLYCLRHQRD
jgi:hypothetical protein